MTCVYTIRTGSASITMAATSPTSTLSTSRAESRWTTSTKRTAPSTSCRTTAPARARWCHTAETRRPTTWLGFRRRPRRARDRRRRQHRLLLEHRVPSQRTEHDSLRRVYVAQYSPEPISTTTVMPLATRPCRCCAPVGPPPDGALRSGAGVEPTEGGLPRRTGVEEKTRLWVLRAGNRLRLPSSTSGESAKPCHDQDAASKEVG